MKILALDTTANTSSVAVLENEALLGIYTVNTKNTHSETLLPMVPMVSVPPGTQNEGEQADRTEYHQCEVEVVGVVPFEIV